MDQSEFLQLNLPSGEDPLSIDALNQNFRKIDLFASESNYEFPNSTNQPGRESTFQKLIMGKLVLPTMGIEIFMENGSFDPKKYGLKVGQLIQVLGIGGGAGGCGGGGGFVLSSRGSSGGGGAGGSSGELKYKSFLLDSLDPIEIIIGKGGNAGTGGIKKSIASIPNSAMSADPGTLGTNGTETKFGNKLIMSGGIIGTAGRGASITAKGSTPTYGYGGAASTNGNFYRGALDGGTGQNASVTTSATGGSQGIGGRGLVLGEPLIFNLRGGTVPPEPLKSYGSCGFGSGGNGGAGGSARYGSNSDGTLTAGTCYNGVSGSPGQDGVLIVTW